MSENEESPFIFVGETLVLDLINTEKVIRGKRQDLLQESNDLAKWWTAARDHHPQSGAHHQTGTVYDQAAFDAVKHLRDHLRTVFLQIIQGSSVQQADFQVLNEVLERVHPTVTWSADQPPHVHYQHEGVSDVLSTVALSALHLLTGMDLSRLRQCHNHRCILLFYDTSKSGTRQWCSTACLERERSLRRYEEKKRAADSE